MSTDTFLQNLSQDLAMLLERVSPTVVAIRGTRSAATGIHWRAGLVVTSWEALHPQDALMIKSNSARDSIEAELLGADPATDVAVLALPEGVELPVAEISTDPLAMGNLVTSVAYRSGRNRATRLRSSLGMISSVNGPWRSLSGGQIDQFIEVDIKLGRGGAGSPLIDTRGRVVGFNTFGPRRSVLAIPASNVERVIQQLQERGKVARGYLGLGMQRVQLPEAVRQSLNLSNQTGIMVVSLDAGAAADQAGILMGDIIVAIEAMPACDLRDLQSFLDPQRVGQPLVLTLLRAGQLQNITVTVGER
ncbi:MAG: trypsin-like peptidase domain-containing protein [Cyanobacteria bacterium P01_D01_bin.44]